MPEAQDAGQLTLRQLQIFCAVAQTGSLTRAAKQLDVRQPSISQQLARMERALGGKLVRFVGAELRLTPAGQYLLAEATAILSSVDRTTAGLGQFFDGRRGRLVIGALPSTARNLLPAAYAHLGRTLPGYTLDLMDVTPREAPDLLQARTLDAAIVSTYAITARKGLRVTPLMHDRQLLAVPGGIDLGAVEDLRQLPAEDLRLVQRTVRYAFGSEHTARVDAWYDALVPGANAELRCRAFETALAFVEAGLGSAIVPELAVRQGGRMLFDVALYALPVEARETVLMTPEQYASVPAIEALTAALHASAAGLFALDVGAVPPFARTAPSEPRGAAQHRASL